MSSLSPADAEVALRTFPRRWRALLDGLDPADPDDAARLDRPGPSGRTALGSAGDATAVLEAATDQLRSVLTADHPTLSTAHPGSAASTPAEALARIEATAPALADAVAAVPSGDLDRGADVDGSPVTVRTLVATAVARAADLLRDAEAALRPD